LHGKKQNSHKLSSTEVQHHAQANEKDTHSININTTHSFQRKYAPYIDANTKIRRALSVRKPFQTREEIRSKQLEKFMILVEKETKVSSYYILDQSLGLWWKIFIIHLINSLSKRPQSFYNRTGDDIKLFNT